MTSRDPFDIPPELRRTDSGANARTVPEPPTIGGHEVHPLALMLPELGEDDFEELVHDLEQAQRALNDFIARVKGTYGIDEAELPLASESET